MSRSNSNNNRTYWAKILKGNLMRTSPHAHGEKADEFIPPGNLVVCVQDGRKKSYPVAVKIDDPEDLTLMVKNRSEEFDIRWANIRSISFFYSRPESE